MNFFDFFNISERNISLINPSTPEKVVRLGEFLKFKEGCRVIDFGSGYAEPLILWAEKFRISGIGIDIREHVCERARQRLKERGLDNDIEIVCGNGSEYKFKEHSFDVATCIGASFVWEGYREAIRAMKKAIRPDGKIGIGEVYWRKADVPSELKAQNPSFHHEHELLQIAREEGFDFEYVIRASHDDWDRYEADNWHGLVQWIEENPGHPEKHEVIDHLHKMQDEYLTHGREYYGWAMYVLTPITYKPVK